VAGYSSGPWARTAYDRSTELAAVGPILDIVIRAPTLPTSISKAERSPHQRDAISAKGLIDTGATHVCIDIRMAVELGLVPTGTESVGVAGGGSIMSDVYAGILEVPQLGFSEMVPLYTLRMRHASHDVLLGRSFLQNFIVTFDGPQGVFHFYTPKLYEYPEHDG
jgi:predicted aspartyl protease